MSTPRLPDQPPPSDTAALPPGCVARCRGCAHRGLDGADSAARKAAWLARALAPWAPHLAPVTTPPATRRWHYRDRVCLSARWQDGGWRLGTLNRGELVPIPDCPVHSRRVSATLGVLGAALPPPERFPLAFHVQSGAQVTLVLKTRRRPDTGWLDDVVTAALTRAGIEGLWLHLNPAAGLRLYTKRGWELLWGRPRSRDTRGLVHGPAAFQQLLPELYEAALAAAAGHLAPGPGRPVLDLCSGTGASLARWQAAGATSLGVELDGEAVACAGLNAPAARVLRGGCATRLPQIREWLAALPAGTPCGVFANPPRTGLEPAVAEWLAHTPRVDRLAYLSCSAGTLARDLHALEAGGLRVDALRPYDFFPQTHHVETLALLSRGQ